MKYTQKFEKIKSFTSVCNLDMKWEILHPNAAGDWINQQNPVFAIYYPLGGVITVSMKTMEIVESLPRFEC